MPRIYPKVAKDMFLVQGSWAFGFMGVMLIIQFVKIMSSILSDVKIVSSLFKESGGVNTYFDSLFIASNIFMLVIGIISAVSVLSHYVSNGVTRKDYFKGTLIGTLGLAITIPVAGAIISAVITFIVNLLNIPVNMNPLDGSMNETEGHLIAELILSIIFTPYEDPSSSWLLAIFIFAINIFTYYVAGWLIGAAFSRFGIFGIVSIVLAFVLIYIEDILISISLGLPVPSFITITELPLAFSVIGTFVLIAIYCWLIRLMTKKIIVKY